MLAIDFFFTCFLLLTTIRDLYTTLNTRGVLPTYFLLSRREMTADMYNVFIVYSVCIFFFRNIKQNVKP